MFSLETPVGECQGAEEGFILRGIDESVTLSRAFMSRLGTIITREQLRSSGTGHISAQTIEWAA